MESIIQTDKDVCYICGRYGAKHEHHIFNGTANRKKSEEDGMKVYVHPTCHEWIHKHELSDLNIKARCQKIWQEHYGKSKEDFIKRYGISYIDKFEEWRNRNENTNKRN